jgi:hypothetical protein
MTATRRKALGPALAAIAARAAETADASPRDDGPTVDARADRVDDANYIVTWHARVLDNRE